MIELETRQLRATFSTLGARLASLWVDGVDVLAGGGDDEQFLAGDWTAGAVCGRMAGRIANAKFAFDGLTYRLTPNLDAHQLHGGPDNFALRNWKAEKAGASVRFSLDSPDGDQGYPGDLNVTADYTLEGSKLVLALQARAASATVVNLTNHAYWNLSGGSLDAFGHELQINAQAFLPLNDSLLPTGELRSVAATPWDFRALRKVGGAYDSCWVLDGERGRLRHGLTLRDPQSGRRMEVWTTEAGMQVYTASHWNGGMPGRRGPLRQHAAIAIEPQNFPDAPNHPNFPSSALRPGDIYRNRMEWRFT